MVIRIFLLIVSIFLAAFFGFKIRNSAYRYELEKARLLAQIVAQKNVLPLQNNFESLLTLEPIPSVSNVSEVLLFDAHGKRVAEWGRGDEQNGAIKIEEPIIGFDQRPLGKVILFYQPILPVFFWGPCLFPLLTAGFFLRPSKKSTSAVPTGENFYPWLPAVETLFGKKLHIFDEEGIVLSSNGSGSPKHLLDLIPEPSRAQDILKSVEKPANSWRDDHGKKLFLFYID